jgi:hypothetical protein
MKKTVIIIVVCIITYCGFYILGQPFCRNEVVSSIWCSVFYPLRLIQFRHLFAGTETERGIIAGSVDDGWCLIYETPKPRPDGHPIGGMDFRVPTDLAEKVYNARYYKKVVVTVAKEPSAKYFNCADYVLTSITVEQ